MWIEHKNGKMRMYDRYKALDGSVRRVSVRLDKDTPQARNKAQRALDDKIQVLTTKNSNCRFFELVRAYRSAKIIEVKESTYRRICRETDTQKKIFGDVKLSDLTAGMVKQKIVDYNPKPSTVNEHIQRFKEIIKWGFKNDYVQEKEWLDKIEKMNDIPNRVKIKDKFLESDECIKLLEAMSDKWRPLTNFLLLSGLRIGEALALDKSDVDMENRYIHVYKSKDPVTGEINTPKTYSSNRDVYMYKDLYNLCQDILDMNKKIRNRSFFPYCEYYAYRKYLRKVSGEVLGRCITPHVLRHTHASLLAEISDKYDYEFIARRLGHQNSRVTKQIYIHVTNRKKELENNSLENVHLF